MEPWHFAAFSNISLEIFVSNLVSLSHHSLQILDRGISDFQIFRQSLIKENDTSNDIGMKLWPLTKLDKRKKSASKKFDDEVTSETFYVIVIFPIYGQFGAIRKPDNFTSLPPPSPINSKKPLLKIWPRLGLKNNG